MKQPKENKKIRNKKVIIKIRENKLRVYVNGRKTFETEISRETIKSRNYKGYKSLKEAGDLYGEDGPCPRGTFYVFYRIRSEGNRLELRKKKPKVDRGESISTCSNLWGVIPRPRRKGRKVNRKNVQIHCGTQSKGCILTKDCSASKLTKMIWEEFLEKGIHVKIKIDSYWRTEEGENKLKEYKKQYKREKKKEREEKKKRRRRKKKTKRCGARCKDFKRYRHCDRLVCNPPCWQHRA
jgi:hypothetical protein